MYTQQPMLTEPDEELCRRSGAGDSRAEETLALRYTPLVRRCSRTLFLMGGDHEDLMQEGMLALVMAIRSYREDRGASFSTYAAQCIRNRMVSAVRKAAGSGNEALNTALPLDEVVHLESREQSVEQQLIRSDQFDRLRRSLTSLEGQVLELYLQGLSYTEIAGSLGRGTKSVDNAVQRIRRKWAELQVF